MILAVGAPVAERAWILPQWLECLANQTLKPDHLCFVYSDSQDETRELLIGNQVALTHLRVSKYPFFCRNDRNKDKKDPWRAKHLSNLRNELRVMFMRTNADVFVSLDTDVLLKDPTALKRLVAYLTDHPMDMDVACGLTYLHPQGEASRCYNAGWLDFGTGYDQAWIRVDENAYRAYRSPIKIDIPMAFFAIKRHPMGMCKYKPHELGEDIGFAQNLAEHKYKVGYCTDVYGTHVWSESYLEAA